ncbi:MAG: hypothetical protein P8Z30_20120 [Acidobacteriota bacterium]
MRKRIGKRAVLLVMGTLFLFSAANGQETKMKPEAYTGTAIGTGGTVGGRSIGFDFRIKRYTTDEEVQKFADLVKEKGTDALRRALEKEDVGQLSVTGRVGNQIAVARKHQVGSNTVITLITARTMPFLELYRSGRSTDYPFGFMQVTLDSKGQGTGQIMAAARIRFNKKAGKYEIESFGNQYVKAVNVRPSR